MNVYLAIGTEYKYDLVEWILKKENITKCFVDYIDSFDKNNNILEKMEGVETIPMTLFFRYDCFDRMDINKYPPLDSKIIQMMKPYESMAIKIAMRYSEYPITEYEDAKYRYYCFLRYWKDFIDANKIGAIFFDETPHNLCKYVLYGLAITLKIKTLMITPTGIRGQYAYGNTVETIGSAIGNAFTNNTIDYEKVELSGVVKQYYEDSLQNKNEASADPKSKEKWARTVYEITYKRYDASVPLLDYWYHNMRLLAASILKRRGLSYYNDNKYNADDLKFLKQVKVAKQHDLCSLIDYQKMAKQPDFQQQYVYFPLQQNPELTLMPLSGEFAEQYTSIQLLAKILEPWGIYVYVKEYYIQKYRENNFWKAIKGINNVVLIDSDVSSRILIDNSIAVASQTGTVLLEGVFANKPALAFGDGVYWKGMPGIYRIHDLEEGRKVIKGIIDKSYSVNNEALLNYFKCIELNTVYHYIDNVSYTIGEKDEKYYKSLHALERLIDSELLC